MEPASRKRRYFELAVRSGMKVPIPLNKPPDTIRERSARPKADGALKVRAIGNVSSTSPGCIGRNSRTAGRPTAYSICGNDLQQLRRLAVADIVNMPRRTAGRRIGLVARPCRVGLRRPLDEPHHGLGYVIDVGEVAPHLSVVEQADGLPCMMAAVNSHIAISGRPHGP